jgi:hypothetical protein
MNVLKYIEKCTGTSHNGPAWVAYVQTSKTGRTIYFNGRALQRAAKGHGQGNHFDVETGEAYWVSGVKTRGSNRHWAGSGHILVEESAVPELLALLGVQALDTSAFRITPDLPRTDPQKFNALSNERL